MQVEVDGATSSTGMFAGNISRPIQVPTEFQNSNYTSVSNNANFTVKNGTIIPTGNVNSTGVITVTYTPLDASLGVTTNTYDLT